MTASIFCVKTGRVRATGWYGRTHHQAAASECHDDTETAEAKVSKFTQEQLTELFTYLNKFGGFWADEREKNFGLTAEAKEQVEDLWRRSYYEREDLAEQVAYARFLQTPEGVMASMRKDLKQITEEVQNFRRLKEGIASEELTNLIATLNALKATMWRLK